MGRERAEPEIEELLIAHGLEPVCIGVRTQQRDDPAIAQATEFVAANDPPGSLLCILFKDAAKFIHA